MGALSAAEVRYIEVGIAQDLRPDGRSRTDYRSISIDTSVIPQANGSALCKVGATDVIISLKAELGRPPLGRPTHGSLAIKIECSPTASPKFELIRDGCSLSCVWTSCVLSTCPSLFYSNLGMHARPLRAPSKDATYTVSGNKEFSWFPDSWFETDSYASLTTTTAWLSFKHRVHSLSIAAIILMLFNYLFDV